MQQLHETGREGERQPATIGDSERHAATTCDQRDSKRQPAGMGDSDRHVATPWDQRDIKRKPATTRDSEGHAATQGVTATDHIATERDMELML